MYEAFLQSLAVSPYHACNAVCETFFALHNPNSSSTISRKKDYHKYIELFVILQTLFKKNGIAFKEPDLKEDLDHNISLIVDFFLESRKSIRKALDIQNTSELVEKFKSQYESNILDSFSYQFNEQQLKNTLELIIQLRKNIRAIRSIPAPHKFRILSSLERLQTVLHKNVPNMDRFWGFMFETRLVLKENTNDVKLVIDLIQKLANIYYQVISNSGDELPFKIESFLPKVIKDTNIT